MKKLKITEEYCAYTEEEAIENINKARENQNIEGYQLGANGYKYKAKKSKGEIVQEAWIVTIQKIYNEVWE